MQKRWGALPILLGVSLAVSPLGAVAQAADDRELSSAGKSAIVTRGNTGPDLKPGPTVKKKAKRNHETYAGGRPLWVQKPIVVKKKGKRSIHAVVSARAFHRPGHHPKARKDHLRLTVAVLKKGNIVPTQGTTMLKTKTVKLKKSGAVKISIPVSKKGAKKLRSKRLIKDGRLYVALSHFKDTYPEAGKDHDFEHLTKTIITQKKVGKKKARKTHARNVMYQKRFEKGNFRVKRSASAKLANMNEVYYTAVYLQNNSTFTYGLTWNPNMQCMEFGGNLLWDYAASTLQANTGWGAVQANVQATTGVVQVFSGSTVDEEQWFASVDGNPSNTTPNQTQALADAGRSTLNGLEDSALNPETYSSVGLLTAGLGALATFGIDLLVDLIKEGDGCNSAGQTWGMNATALYVGQTSNLNAVYGNQYYWSTGYAYTVGYGGTESTIGQPQTFNENPPATQGSSDWEAMEAMLNSAVGQQTQVTYFHNGGMPAPFYADDGNTQWSGAASYSQGHVQWIYPNPGSCMNNDCNTGETYIQFGYMMNGFDGPVGPQMTQFPTASVSTGTDANTGQPVTNVSCQVPNTGTFVNPFTGTQGSPGASSAVELNSLQGMPGVNDALFSVSYYALDANGNYLYNSNTTSQAQFPGPLAGSTAYGAAEYPPTLQASENSNQLLQMNQANNPTMLGLSAGDLASLINPSTGQAATATQFGCVVVPLVSWEGMNVESGSVWGGNWPWPQVTAGGPLSSPYNNYFNWTFPVNSINMAWSGDPYISAPVPAP